MVRRSYGWLSTNNKVFLFVCFLVCLFFVGFIVPPTLHKSVEKTRGKKERAKEKKGRKKDGRTTKQRVK